MLFFLDLIATSRCSFCLKPSFFGGWLTGAFVDRAFFPIISLELS